jgi:basic amino acid/polyamine antiporter, APA family
LNTTKEEGLKRVIGVRTLAANAVNLTVGAGIFALPAIVASFLGAASFLAYALCFILIMMVLLCFVEVGSKINSTGGAYSYIETAFGPLAGFLSNILFWFGYCVMADAAVANVLVDNLGTFWPALQQPTVRTLFLFVVFGGIALLNVRGVKQGAVLSELTTLAKIIPLVVLVGVGLFFVKPDNLVVNHWPSVSSLGEVSLVLFFAFGGVEASLNASGEIKNPKKTIPRGILLGVFIVFILYVLIQFVAQGVLGNTLPDFQDAPLVAVADVVFGPAGTTFIVIGTAISCFGLISSDILNSSRLPFAAARDGLLPTFLARVHPGYATPYIAIIMYAGVGFILSVSGGFSQLAVMASAALLLMYLGVILATIKLRRVKSQEHSFTLPGGIIIPVVAMIATLWFLSNLALEELLLLAGFLVFFSIIYIVMKFNKGKNSLI